MNERDTFAMNYDSNTVQFPSLDAMFDFVGAEPSDDFVTTVKVGLRANAKLAYFYADAMVEASNGDISSD